MTAPTITSSGYTAAVAELRARLVAYAAAVWGTATLTDETITRLVEYVGPAVIAAQLQVANLTSVYLAAQTGTSPLPVSDVVAQGRGIPVRDEFARPVITARTAISQGKTLDQALRAGGRRLESLATTDIQMAKTRQADASLAHAGVEHYRRVPKGAGTCAMCLIASTQRYKVGTLSPIHPGCDCGVDVIPAGMDLEEVLDVNLLNTTHAKVEAFAGVQDRGGRAVDYRKLIVEREHGEIGPLLTWKGDHFDTGFAPVNLDL